ncbi:MAG: 30S ribosome-binding factor RbfA [Eubacteriales bacterium]
MGKNYRKDRLGEEIKKLIGEMLINGLKDPRFSGFISVSAVDVTSDLSYATVYVSALFSGSEEEIKTKKQDVLAAFFSAKGMIKKEIGRKISLRHIPELIFKLDETMEYSRHMSELIDDAVKKDRRINTMDEVVAELQKADSVILFPHVNMDGDTLGSSVALCRALKQLGKEAYVLIDEEIPQFLDFLSTDCCTDDFDCIEKPDVCVCIDCGDAERFKNRSSKFFEATVTGCIDHHITTEPFAKFNYVDPKAAATAEIIYDLIQELAVEIDDGMAEAIFTGITTDTGNFQYSSTTARTHEIVSELYELDVDYSKVSVNLYQRNRVEKLRLQAKILSQMKIFEEGKAAICFVTKKMLEEENAVMEDTEGVIDALRSIAGVEIAGFVKELSEELCKVSLRSKSYINVADISLKFNGGGHHRAAGFSLANSLQDAMEILEEVIGEAAKTE